MGDQPNHSEPEKPKEEPRTQRVAGTLNYLRWLAAEDMHEKLGLPLDADTALGWFCQTLPHRPLLAALRSRYAQLVGLDHQVFFFPAGHPVLIEKVLIPLHQAKVAFVLGHEFGCIAMCGMVGEMLSIIRFQMSKDTLTKAQQKRLLGGEFEDLEHSRRIDLLELLGMLDAPTADLFDELRKIRNGYLHRLSQPHTTMPKDAMRAYQIAAKLVATVCGLGAKNAHVTISPELLAFMRAGGLGTTQSEQSNNDA